MCFSADVSFTAGVILTVAGIVLVGKFYKKKELFLALIPLFFGIQQFVEGVLWISLRNNSYPQTYSLIAQYIFLFFAEMFWPIWVPFAFRAAEKVLWRRNVILGLMIIGFCFSYYIGYHFIVSASVRVKIVEHSLNYGVSPSPYRILYAVITLTPFFLSSIPKMWILAIANTLAFIVASIFYSYAFVSIWCAFAAILAIGFFVVLKKPVKKKLS